MSSSPPLESAPSPGRLKELFRKYGKVAVGVHLSVYACFFAGCYIAVENHLDVRGQLAKYGLLSEKAYDDTANSDPAAHSWLERTMSGALTGAGSSVALAFLANKALMPVRVPITLGLTPVVARLLGKTAPPPR